MKYDLRNLNPETIETAIECSGALDQCGAALSKVKQQLLDASVKFNTTGERTDPRWFTAARAAQAALGRLHQKLTGRLGRLNRAERAVAHDAQCASFELLFRKVVAEHVGSETCGAWLTEARERQSRGERA